MEKVNIAGKLSLFSDYFNPRIVGELNGQQVKLVKFKGEFVWHHHEHEDELFYVIRGSFDMHLRPDNHPDMEEVITLNPGEFIIIHSGKEHTQVAQDKVEIMLFEPASTLNTGNQVNEKTRRELKRI